MKTIKERVKEFAEREYCIDFDERVRIEFGYFHGATDQRDIDLKEFADRLTEMQGEYITLELINELVKEMKDEQDY